MKFNFFNYKKNRDISGESNTENIPPELLNLIGELQNLISKDKPVEGIKNPDSIVSELDEPARYQLAESISMAIYPKYKFSEYGRLFLEDEEFLEYYKRFMDPGNWHSLDRKYTLNQLLKLVIKLEGDLVECGVYKGASAYLLCQNSYSADKTVHLFDSFEGLSTPGQYDGNYWHKGALRSDENELRSALGIFNNFEIYKGWIPECFSDYPGRNICFLHIDVDLFDPTMASLDYFYERLISGGVIVMDDYGFLSCPGAKSAADSFFSDKEEEIIMLPTGQAFVMKL